MIDRPILYSFRRCPYAIRARLAITASGQRVELREIVLRDKAPEFLETSPSATVPCLKDGGSVLDESLDIMLWALKKSDPDAWLLPEAGTLAEVLDLIGTCDGPFKRHLDRYKYDTRYADADKDTERGRASEFLWLINGRLAEHPWLFGSRACLADFAILPFVRQFANADRDWFDRQDWSALKGWLAAFETSDRFQAVMAKWPRWQSGDEQTLFP
ncbi:glutathione S-transferase [Roseibium sediminicola]|uniref:Glutathione S-transferase n=1 Tax=Roseibium sediminicola TaxID=2933272 RepID=A0ABT0GQG1_9HYPH|nr:glutathione S-transferase [Roseibium sp. CAU 1639]MCK7611643.1 glutathione S-transferase [Roseibium sp. CAU 1639]